MTRLSMLAAFLAGTLCGVSASLWHPQRRADLRSAAGGRPVRRPSAAGPELPLLWAGSPHATVAHATRNLFAYFEPPPAPVLHTVGVPAMVVAAQPRVIETPQPRAPEPPPFTYRYIGTFGPRESALAVFARDGEVVNARVGDAVDGRFTLRRIGVESVDLGWGGPSDLRVALSAAASPAR